MTNREIKFRGLDFEKKWHCGYYWSWNNKHYIREAREDGGWEDFLVKKETVQQFINLKDKNGSD